MAYLDELETLEPRSREEWRAWLERNHDSSRGIAVAVVKKHAAQRGVTYEDAVEEALSFGWIDSMTRRLDRDRFKQLFTPRRPTSPWSATNRERAERLIAEGRMTPAGLEAVERAKANGSWDPDHES